jgi:hypothetical protein
MASLRVRILREEKETNVLFNEIAENKVNWKAGQKDVEPEEE